MTRCETCHPHSVGFRRSACGPFAPSNPELGEAVLRCCHCDCLTSASGVLLTSADVSVWLPGCDPTPARFTPGLRTAGDIDGVRP